MKKYGLQLRKPMSAAAPSSSRPPLPPPAFAFRDDEDGEDDVEREISRQAAKNRALQKIEEQHKKALEEDPSVFDYDGVYDEMKEEIARPKHHDRVERKPKYIEKLIKKAKEREREHEIIYERKLLKERSKDDHLFEDKEKFVTSAYRKKLEEQRQWLEEDRQRQLLEEKEDVTKKKDLSDFYFGLDKNVAYGARGDKTKPNQAGIGGDDTQRTKAGLPENESPVSPISSSQDTDKVEDQSETFASPNQPEHALKMPPAKDGSPQENSKAEQTSADEKAEDRYKRNNDALAAARERYMARKKAKVQ